jgi:hypothetical protein
MADATGVSFVTLGQDAHAPLKLQQIQILRLR